MLTLVDVLTRTERWLREREVPSPRLEAEMILAHVLGVERLQLYLSYDRPLTDAELKMLRPLVARRGDREPLSWILGSRGFHDIELLVQPGVLDPRPDTEVLVEAVLAWIPAEGEDPVYVADVGSGTGAVGLALAVARPQVRLYAVDIDDVALRVTRRNVEALDLGARVAVLRGDLLDAVPEARPIDWVVSNPPYIPSGEIDGLMPEVSRHEPRRALDGGPDGLDVYRRLVPAAASRARQGLAVEIGQHQEQPVRALFEQAGLKHVEVLQDLGGIGRVLLVRVC